MRDEDDGFHVVHLSEKAQLLFDTARVPERLETSRQRNRSARHRDAVVARQVETVVEEVIHVIADAPVGAIDRRREDAFGRVRDGTDERHGSEGPRVRRSEGPGPTDPRTHGPSYRWLEFVVFAARARFCFSTIEATSASNCFAS